VSLIIKKFMYFFFRFVFLCVCVFDLGILPMELETDQILAAWEIFSCLCNGGTLVVRGTSWESALNEVSLISGGHLFHPETLFSSHWPFRHGKGIARAEESANANTIHVN